MVDKELNARIEEVRQYSGLNFEAFGKSINVAKSTINAVINNKKNAGAKIIYGIVTTYDEISADWLLKGIGEMIVHKKEQIGVTVNRVSKQIDQLENSLNEFKAEVKKLEEKQK